MKNNLLAWLGLALLAGCTMSDVYDVDAISNVVISAAGRGPRTLTYTLRLDTMYYSPGVKVSRKDGAERLQVVKCKVGKTCAFDLPSETNGSFTQVTLPGDAGEKVFIDGKSGKFIEVALPH